jgi:hypothetical protein
MHLFRLTENAGTRVSVVNACAVAAGLTATLLFQIGNSKIGWWLSGLSILCFLSGLSWRDSTHREQISIRSALAGELPRPVTSELLGPCGSDVLAFLRRLRALSDDEWLVLEASLPNDDETPFAGPLRGIWARQKLKRALRSVAGQDRIPAFEAALTELCWIISEREARGTPTTTLAVMRASSLIEVLVHHDLLDEQTVSIIESSVPLATLRTAAIKVVSGSDLR